MSNEFYKLLETMDQLESARDLLEPAVTESNVDTRDIKEIYGYIRLKNGNEFDLEGEANLADIVAGVQTYGIDSIGGEDIGDEAHNLVVLNTGDQIVLDSPEQAEEFYTGLEGLEEANTKVEKMGNKVKVTQNGDTTEFNDAETAADFMDMDKDDQFTTESEEADEEVVDEDAETEEEVIDEETEEVVDEDAEEVEEGLSDAIDRMIDADLEDGPEFDTFDSENPMHRERLQRGTPVVLNPALFKDPDCNRRGVFVNRSPSGFYGSVIRDCDGKTVNVHLSDIVSADIVNNSIYEAYNLDFEAMLAEDTEQLNEDITVTNTTNPDAPENDTMTVTAIGPDAVEELDAIMANAGLARDYDAPVDMGVDDGTPEVPLSAPEPGEEVVASGSSCMREDDWDDLLSTLDALDSVDTEFDELEPSDADLAAIDADPVAIDDEEFAEERDIKHANTPDEMTAGVDVMTRGIAGGLNKEKQMYPPAAGGDNPKTVYQEYGLDEEWDDGEDMIEGIEDLGDERELGGDAADELLNDIEADEEGMREEEEAEEPKIKSGKDFAAWLQSHEDWKEEQGLGGSRRQRGSMRRGTEGGVRFEDKVEEDEYGRDQGAMYDMEYSPIGPDNPCYDCGSTIDGHHTPSCDLANPGDARDLPEEPGTQYWTGEVAEDDTDSFLSLYKEFSNRGEKR